MGRGAPKQMDRGRHEGRLESHLSVREEMMRPALLLLSTTIAPAAALAADATLAFQLAADPANMTACLALGPSFDRPFTVTVSGDVVELISPAGIRSRMDPVGQDVYHTAFELS